MAQKPLRPCAHQGCSVLVRGTWCEKHRPKRTDSRSRAATGWRRLYTTDVWKKQLRPAQLAREPYCRECVRWGLRVPATDVDHIVPHEGDMALFTDPANLQSLCHRCHSFKTARENANLPPKNKP